jgi:4-amino-4-deoxy-L-arabinose transferase-like glycosyltransferase
VRAVPRRELAWLGVLLAIALVVRIAYVALHGGTLAGDQIEYASEGRLIASGHWFWSFLPYGIPHASIFKAPLYPAWLGAWFAAFGEHYKVVEAAQAVISTGTVALTWLLARRLFGPAVALASAGVMAIYPFAFQYDGLLYAEALATPLTVLVLWAVLERAPTAKRAAAVGALLGALLLLRPSSLFLVPLVLVAWLLTGGARRGALMSALCVAVAALVVAPWTIRNAVVTGAFVPISAQDAAASGTFNDDAAHDPVYPWAWRQLPERDRDVFDPRHPRPDAVWRAELLRRARDYVEAHPDAVPKALFWNGLVRTWDVRTPVRVLDEVPFEGRTRWLTAVGLGLYWALLAIALTGLWRLRRRLTLLLPVLAAVAAAAVVYTVDGGTRYRAPLEPLVVVLACSSAVPALRSLRARQAATRSRHSLSGEQAREKSSGVTAAARGSGARRARASSRS